MSQDDPGRALLCATPAENEVLVTLPAGGAGAASEVPYPATEAAVGFPVVNEPLHRVNAMRARHSKKDAAST